jgi:hypothetical protein
MEAVSLKKLPKEAGISLLRELGYDSDGTWVLTGDGSRHTDRYTGEAVRLSNMLILPGSAVVIDSNPLSIACYFDEFGEFS